RNVPASTLHVNFGHVSARIVDVSEGGVRLEAAEGVDFPPTFELIGVEIPATVRVRSVWTRLPSRGWIWCGAELCDDNPEHLASWHLLIAAVRERGDHRSVG